jgi:hypothetical protein
MRPVFIFEVFCPVDWFAGLRMRNNDHTVVVLKHE